MSDTKNYKWNITLEDGSIIAYTNILDILLNCTNFKIQINLLIQKLLDKTNHIVIKNYKKKKNIINFIRINYGSIQKFINKYPYLSINNKYVFYSDPDLKEWEYI